MREKIKSNISDPADYFGVDEIYWADLAKHVLRAVHYVVTAQRYLSDNAKQFPSSDQSK